MTSPRVLLATEQAVLMAPAMNVRMWNTPPPSAMSRNSRAMACHVGPDDGEMA